MMMHFTIIDDGEPQICVLATDQDMDTHLASDMEAHAINGAQWFRTADLWYRLSSTYSNALTIGRLNAEWSLIEADRHRLTDILADTTLVFFGVGVGNTEMALIDFQLDRCSYAETVLIDINPTFLQTFIFSLASKRMEDSRFDLRYVALRAFFEQISFQHVTLSNSKYSRKSIVCLGSTIGNVANTYQALAMFDRLARSGDIIVLGYQLRNHLRTAFHKYEHNSLYREIIGNFLPPHERARIQWRLNESEGAIEAWLGDIQICRSKKFSVDAISSLACKLAWREVLCSVDAYKNLCVHVFEKT